jgi:two-component system response regulator AtoC
MYNRERVKISPRLMELFMNYGWQGNIREVENIIKRLVILGNESQLISELLRKKDNGSFSSFPEGTDEFGRPSNSHTEPTVGKQSHSPVRGDGGGVPQPEKGTLKEVAKIAQRKAERDLIDRVLRQTRWNRRKAAQILDISYKALLYKIKECGLNQD